MRLKKTAAAATIYRPAGSEKQKTTETMQLRSFCFRITALSLIVFFSCNPGGVSVPTEDTGTSALAGTWVYVELGYSIGAGYTVEEVPTRPRQTLTLAPDGTVRAEGADLAHFNAVRRYEQLTDPAGKVYAIALEADRSADGTEPFGPDNRLNVRITADSLKLYSPACIEGCHQGFIRAETH
jgi:hypothetical protein